ncbi:glycosyltransferase [Marinobacter sp. ST-43]|uniref:glycosyltransferase n=1 Tax=Marinobacter sp. ST-43 TaxID=3050453 RepID=UPI0026DEF4DE|nr:glycosyltransferase [Marinobacter sp. ST-43]
MYEFSVLMSVYRGDSAEHFLEAAESILNQTLPPLEVVIVQDGPVPSLLEGAISDLSNRFEKVKVIKLTENVGLAKALNVGLEHCKFEMVARMDADDISLENRFESMIPKFLGRRDLSLMGGQHIVFDSNMSISEGVRRVPTEFEDIVKFSRLRTPINHPTIVFRKADVLEVGGYPENVGRFEDWGLCLALFAKGKKIVNSNDVVLHVRGGGDMMARRSGFKYMLEEVRALNQMRRNGFISLFWFSFNVVVRSPLRFLSSDMIKVFYNRVLRA